MLVGAAEECDLVMAKLTPQGAGERVRGQCLVGAADVRRPITVENCGSDMDSLAHWLLRARRQFLFRCAPPALDGLLHLACWRVGCTCARASSVVKFRRRATLADGGAARLGLQASLRAPLHPLRAESGRFASGYSGALPCHHP